MPHHTSFCLTIILLLVSFKWMSHNFVCDWERAHTQRHHDTHTHRHPSTHKSSCGKGDSPTSVPRDTGNEVQVNAKSDCTLSHWQNYPPQRSPTSIWWSSQQKPYLLALRHQTTNANTSNIAIMKHNHLHNGQDKGLQTPWSRPQQAQRPTILRHNTKTSPTWDIRNIPHKISQFTNETKHQYQMSTMNTLLANKKG